MIVITAPPSKSMSHRMLIGAALARGDSILRHVLDSDDIARTRGILQAAGAHMGDLPDGGLRVRGVAGALLGAAHGGPDALSCDVHESGTSCRLLMALLAAGQGRFRICGAARLYERPVRELAPALEKLGATITWEGRAGYPPLTIEARGLSGGELEIDLDSSSQYLSGLLLAAPLCREKLIISLGGTKAVSWPYVRLTLQTLEDFGIPFEVWKNDGAWNKTSWRSLANADPGGLRFHMRPAAYRAGNFQVEGDWSGAAYFLAAGALGKNAVRVNGLRADSLQGDRVIMDILQRMGARVEEDAAGVAVHPSPLRGIDADMGHCPDLVPTVAALAAFASGATSIYNAAHLRIKESDRIAAITANLRAAGITALERPDGLTVEGGIPQAAPLLRAFGDHRMAMSAALLGIRHGSVRLDDPSVVAKSFPTFWKLWEKVLAPA